MGRRLYSSGCITIINYQPTAVHARVCKRKHRSGHRRLALAGAEPPTMDPDAILAQIPPSVTYVTRLFHQFHFFTCYLSWLTSAHLSWRLKVETNAGVHLLSCPRQPPRKRWRRPDRCPRHGPPVPWPWLLGVLLWHVSRDENGTDTTGCKVISYPIIYFFEYETRYG
jgi:hypothetical protein